MDTVGRKKLISRVAQRRRRWSAREVDPVPAERASSFRIRQLMKLNRCKVGILAKTGRQWLVWSGNASGKSKG